MNLLWKALANNQHQILDVTLRDGGYMHQWALSPHDVMQVAAFLASLPINIIEVGYASDQQKYGCNGTLSPDFLKQLRSHIPKDKKLAIMLFQEETHAISCLESRLEHIDLVRLPVRPNSLEKVQPLVTLCRQYDTACSINITKVSTYETDELMRYVEQITELSVDIIYLADSRGALYPEKVAELFSQLTSSFPQQAFGFHAHNNLSLAFINSVAAVSAGAKYLDSSLCGLGLGSGNFMTELLLFYLYRSSEQLSSIIATIMNHSHVYQCLAISPQKLKYILSGILNIAQETAEEAENLLAVYTSDFVC